MPQAQGAKFLIPFGSLFLAVGIVVGVVSVRTLLRAEAMLTWREAQATVLTCTLNRENSSDGATYRVGATYTYEAGGKRCTGDRVSLHSGADNIGTFHQRTYAELDACRTRNVPTRCWFNPARPEESVLIRKPRTEMIILFQLFTLAFGGAGLAIVLTGAFLLLQRARVAADDGLIRMRGTATHRVMAAIALLWNVYAGWLLWALWRVLDPEPVPWYLWTLAGAGALLAAAAGYLLQRFRKFGISEFALSPAPGVVGGPVTGMIRIPAKVEAAEGFELRLQCFHRYTARSGGKSSTRTDTHWADERHAVTAYSYGDDTQVPVRFAVPFNQPETSTRDGGDSYFWRLTASASAPGIDYRAVFDVPVRRTAQSLPDYSAALTPDAAAQPGKAEDAIRRLSLRMERKAEGGLELIFPAARAKGMLFFLSVFMAVWTGICYALWFVVKAPLLFPVLFTFFDLFLCLSVCDMLLVTRGIVLDRTRRQSLLWLRLFGITVREQMIPFDEILAFQCERSGESGNTVYFRITLMPQGGRPLTVGNTLKSWNDAEQVVQLLTDGVA